MKNLHTQESGRSMVEMLGVLAIVGVLSVGGIAGYSQAMSKFKVTKAMDQVQTIITNIRTLYASQRTYSALLPTQAQALGILTEESIAGTDGLNPFGGGISFDVGTGNRTFKIKYTGLTPEACAKMATADWGADESSGLVSITVGNGTGAGTSHKWASTGASSNLLPVTISAAATECGVKADGFVEWEYR